MPCSTPLTESRDPGAEPSCLYGHKPSPGSKKARSLEGGSAYGPGQSTPETQSHGQSRPAQPHMGCREDPEGPGPPQGLRDLHTWQGEERTQH